MGDQKPLLGIYYGKLDDETQEKLNYYQRNKKKLLMPLIEKIVDCVYLIIALPTLFVVTLNVARKVRRLWGFGDIMSILLGLLVWIFCMVAAFLLIRKTVFPPIKAHDQRIKDDNATFYEIVMNGTVMDRAHRLERMKADIARMKAAGIWKEEYMPEELKDIVD